jgi:hypothetical protein
MSSGKQNEKTSEKREGRQRGSGDDCGSRKEVCIEDGRRPKVIPLATYDPFTKIFCNLEECESECRNVGEEEVNTQGKDKELRLLTAEQEGRESIACVGEEEQEESMEMEEGILTTQEGGESERGQSQGKTYHQTDVDMGGQGDLDRIK